MSRLGPIPRVPLGQTTGTNLMVFRNVDLTYAGTVKGTDGNQALFPLIAPNGRLYNAIAIHAAVLNNTWTTGTLELKVSASLDIPFASLQTPVTIAKTTLFDSTTQAVGAYGGVFVTTAEAVTGALDLYVFLGQT